MRNAFLTSAAMAALASAGPAYAAIYDVAATDSAGVTITLTQGRTYKVEWIGIADGGAYDAANPSCPSAACANGWSNAYTVRYPDFGSSFFELITYSTGAVYGSAAQSLAAYQTQPIIVYSTIFVNGVSQGTNPVAVAANGFTFTPGPVVDFNVVVGDLDGTRTNNYGGVSLRVTEVPEPATWLAMTIGFAAAGATLRRRRAASVSA
jgi:hypothetical protein